MKPFIYVFLFVLAGVYSCGDEQSRIDEFYPHANRMDTIRHNGDLRTYKLYVPDSYDETKAVPLVIAMHGYGNTATEMEQASGLDIKAEAEGFIVAYPEGKDYPDGDNSTRIWNSGPYLEEITGGTDDVGFISEMTDLISKYYSIDERQIFATGFSNGGSMCYKLASGLSCKLAAIAPHSGLLVFSPSPVPACRIPVIHIHGLGDGMVSYSEDNVDIVLCIWNNWDACSEEADTTFENEDFLVKEWQISGNILYLSKAGRHSWFINSNAGLNANDVIWDFFKTHPKDN